MVQVVGTASALPERGGATQPQSDFWEIGNMDMQDALVQISFCCVTLGWLLFLSGPLSHPFQEGLEVITSEVHVV